MMTKASLRLLMGLVLAALVLQVLVFMTSSWSVELCDVRPSSVQRHYITVEYTAQRRLGNLMFDYASLLGIAHAHNMTPVMPAAFPVFGIFDLQCIEARDVSAYISMAFRVKEDWGAGRYRDLGSKLPAAPYDVVLTGFFQSWKYFTNISAEVRRHFTFKTAIQTGADAFISNVKRTHGEDVVLVGVHVRRGDVLTAADIIAKGYTTPDASYYHEAMHYFRVRHPSVHFIVCTDTPAWVREHLASARDVTIASGWSAAHDLAVLGACDHMIMSVGTFGWWAAWLANGTTIYYSAWPKPHSHLHSQMEARDYFPPQWIPMQ